MYSILQHAHSGLRWIILILLLVSLYNSFTKRNNSEFSASDMKTYLFTMTFTHVQFLLGLILLFISPRVQFTEGWIKDSVLRFFGMEHTAMMIIALILITLGYARSKRKDTVAGKHKVISIFYGIALLIILAAIPWPFRGLGSGWF